MIYKRHKCLLHHNKNHKCIFQATPTLLRHIGPQLLKSTLLSQHSSLRVLAIGGEVRSFSANILETPAINQKFCITLDLLSMS